MFICQTSQRPWYRSLDFNSALLEKSRNDQFKQTKMKLNQITKLTRKLNSISPHDRLHFIQSVYNPPPPWTHQSLQPHTWLLSLLVYTCPAWPSHTFLPLLNLYYSYTHIVPQFLLGYLILSCPLSTEAPCCAVWSRLDSNVKEKSKELSSSFPSLRCHFLVLPDWSVPVPIRTYGDNRKQSN